MTSLAQWSTNTWVLILVLLAVSLWLFLQKSCVSDREASLAPAMSVLALAVQDSVVSRRQGHVVPIYIKDGKRAESPETPSRSLKHAAALLGKAADVVETNDIAAVQLIRQVISILKYQVIPSLIEPDATSVPIEHQET